MTPNVKIALKNAVDLAYSLGETQVGTEHLLYGLASVENSVAGQLLLSAGANKNSIYKMIKMSRAVTNSFIGQVNMEYTPRVKDIIRKAYAVSCEVMAGYIVTEHLLYALLCDSGCSAVNILESGLSVDVNRLLNKTIAEINGEGEEEDYQSKYTSNAQNGYTNNTNLNSNNLTAICTCFEWFFDTIFVSEKFTWLFVTINHKLLPLKSHWSRNLFHQFVKFNQIFFSNKWI